MRPENIKSMMCVMKTYLRLERLETHFLQGMLDLICELSFTVIIRPTRLILEKSGLSN